MTLIFYAYIDSIFHSPFDNEIEYKTCNKDTISVSLNIMLKISPLLPKRIIDLTIYPFLIIGYQIFALNLLTSGLRGV